MKKARRMTAVVLCICLLVLLLPPVRSGADSLSFISVNDLLPSELVDSLYSYGGVFYAPYSVFTAYGLGIYYSYFSESSTAYLYSTDKQLFFCLSDGSTFDGDNYSYSTSAIMRNGIVYLPVTFMCSFFGLSYSYLTGSEYGSVLRVKNGSQVLTDAEFIRAARTLMQSYYDSYNAAIPAEPSPSPDNTPGVEQGEQSREWMDVTLNFIGLPSDALLETLDACGAGGCFFLTAEEVRSSPDTVRRLTGEGHALGVYSLEDVEAEYDETSGLIFEAAHAVTVLVTAADGYEETCAALARERGLVYCARGLDAVARDSAPVSAYHVVYELDAAPADTDIFMDSASAERTLPTILDYLLRSRCGILLLRETG